MTTTEKDEKHRVTSFAHEDTNSRCIASYDDNLLLANERQGEQLEVEFEKYVFADGRLIAHEKDKSPVTVYNDESEKEPFLSELKEERNCLHESKRSKKKTKLNAERYCAKCRGHGHLHSIVGHVPCPVQDCLCAPCQRVVSRRRVKNSSKIRRKLMKSSVNVSTLAAVEAIFEAGRSSPPPPSGHRCCIQ
ncbi:hypothetical protein HDE_01308 [Halotydeus destructor]|nr:hypothetical protein HDE_01308 [Halotydeus destructor]